MATDYNETIAYWDNVLGQIEGFNPLEEIKVPQIEDAVSWICKDSQSILDFGFGTGKVIFRCLAKGVKRICGIDISSSAVRLAESVAIKNGFRERAKFIKGSIGALKQIESSAYDSIILFNILDNLKPDDALELLTEAKRILKVNGKVLVKLNPYLEEEKTGLFERLDEDFFLEETGLYLWNISDARFKEVIDPYFALEKYLYVEFKEHKITNRMYYLRNRT